MINSLIVVPVNKELRNINRKINRVGIDVAWENFMLLLKTRQEIINKEKLIVSLKS
jgi:hypothetical protein